jgi:hypothetical protein
MKSKRLINYSIVFFSILILSTQFTNAGFFDLFKKPDLGPVDVNVDLQNSPPIIAQLFEIPASYGQPSFVPPFTLTPASTNNLVYIGILAEDPNGETHLPDMVGAPVAGIIGGGIGAPLTSVNPSLTYAFGSCTSVNCQTGVPIQASPLAVCNNPTLQKVYVCDVDLPYYAPPSGSQTVPNELWRVSASITDSQGATSPVITSGDPGFTTAPDNYIRINSLTAANPQVGSSFDISGVSLTGTNQPATSPVTLENLGNSPLTTTDVIGFNLIGSNDPTATLDVGIFSVGPTSGGSPPAECDVSGGTAFQLSDGATVNIPGLGIPYTAQGASIDNTNIYTCVNLDITASSALTGTDTSFTSTWQINLG